MRSERAGCSADLPIARAARCLLGAFDTAQKLAHKAKCLRKGGIYTLYVGAPLREACQRVRDEYYPNQKLRQSIAMRPVSPALFEATISKPRLDSYRRYFRTRSIDEAIGLYMWNCELTSCFWSLLSAFEIALRNNVHRAMSRFCSRGAQDSIHWYDNLSLGLLPETLDKVRRIRRTKPRANPDEIVSRVTFGFWTAALSATNNHNASNILPVVFPSHPLNTAAVSWSDGPTRKSALAFVHELNGFRNRVAHHEPLWKFAAIRNTSVNPPVTLFPASMNEVDSLARLNRLLGLIDAAVVAIDPQLHADLLASSWRRKLEYLLSPRGLARYRGMKHSLPALGVTPTLFRRSFGLVVKANQPIYVRRAKVGGIFIPD